VASQSELKLRTYYAGKGKVGKDTGRKKNKIKRGFRERRPKEKFSGRLRRKRKGAQKTGEENSKDLPRVWWSRQCNRGHPRAAETWWGNLVQEITTPVPYTEKGTFLYWEEPV